jgi:hypothetical protein
MLWARAIQVLPMAAEETARIIGAHGERKLCLSGELPLKADAAPESRFIAEMALSRSLVKYKPMFLLDSDLNYCALPVSLRAQTILPSWDCVLLTGS